MVTPGVVVAAPASGSGKTTIATGLLGALRRAGHRVAGFKVGPDYIDPSYHTVASGRPGRNLDPVLVGRRRIGALYRYGSAGCDIAVVEGVMGLFDGRIGGFDARHDDVAEGSTAQVAGLLGAPVILVVDARGYGQSLAAVLHGFLSFQTGVRVGGVIVNRVGSQRHEQIVRAACAKVGVPVLGVVPRDPAMQLPSRHLGLVPAVEHGRAAAVVSAMTEIVARYVDLEAVVRLADTSVTAVPWDPSSEMPGNLREKSQRSPTIAMIGGRAFSFGYPEHSELLTAAGADLRILDPTREDLPEDIDGVIIPGGFPEEYAGDLAANTPFRTRLTAAARRGMPIHAECAGLVYLCRRLDEHPMTGILDCTATFADTLTLGYRDAVALTDSVLWRAGQRVCGHEFHRTRLRGTPERPAWGWRTAEGNRCEGAVAGTVHASYLHTHPAGCPAAIARFVESASAYRDKQ